MIVEPHSFFKQNEKSSLKFAALQSGRGKQFIMKMSTSILVGISKIKLPLWEKETRKTSP